MNDTFVRGLSAQSPVPSEERVAPIFCYCDGCGRYYTVFTRRRRTLFSCTKCRKHFKKRLLLHKVFEQWQKMKQPMTCDNVPAFLKLVFHRTHIARIQTWWATVREQMDKVRTRSRSFIRSPSFIRSLFRSFTCSSDRSMKYSNRASARWAATGTSSR